MRKSPLFVELSILGLIFAVIALIGYTILEKVDFHTINSFDNRVKDLLSFSLYQALLSTLFSILLGVILAWALHYRQKFFGRELLLALISSSMVLPSIIVVFGIIGVYGRNGWMSLFFDSLGIDFGSIYGLKGIVLAHIYLNSSFATKSLLHSLDTISFERYKLSHSLNLNLWQRFIHIELRAMIPTIKTIFSTIFLLCFSSFAVVLLLGGGPQNSTLELAIYESIRINYDLSLAIKYSIFQLIISIFIIALSSKDIFYQKSLSLSHYKLEFLQTNFGKTIQYLLIATFALFFVAPLMVLIKDGIKGDLFIVLKDELFIKSFSISILIATLSSLLATIFTLILSDLRRTFALRSRLKRGIFSKIVEIFISFVSNIYLAVSSLIFGLGFFLISLRFHIDQNSTAWFALIATNILLTLPFSISIVYPILYKIALKYDKLTTSLDLSLKDEWKIINLPHLKRALIYVFSLSFCFSLGDLGIIALFGNESFTTLPWYLYSLMGSYQSSKASVVALLMLCLTLIIFLGGEYLANRKRS